MVTILGLLFISMMAIAGQAWLGLMFGALELAVAQRVTPPAGARALASSPG
jgi:hypothetical protein